jgi:hypothetical protein
MHRDVLVKWRCSGRTLLIDFGTDVFGEGERRRSVESSDAGNYRERKKSIDSPDAGVRRRYERKGLV